MSDFVNNIIKSRKNVSINGIGVHLEEQLLNKVMRKIYKNQLKKIIIFKLPNFCPQTVKEDVLKKSFRCSKNMHIFMHCVTMIKMIGLLLKK